MAMPSNAVIGPAVTACLFYAVFAVAYGDVLAAGIPKSLFVAPGVILMAAVQNAFHTSAASMVGAKIHGSLADLMMSPLAIWEWLCGHLVAGMLRALMIAALVLLILLPVAGLPLTAPVAAIGWIALTGAIFAMLGLMAGLVTEKFDRMNDWIAFLVMPLSFLCGSFFSPADLPEPWATLLLLNPAAHLMDGFRWAMLGDGIWPVWRSVVIGAGICTALVAANAALLTRGVGIRS